LKPIRWTAHALDNLRDREIDRQEVEQTLLAPEIALPEQPPREIWMRRYFDTILQQEMLLRVVVEETPREIVVITVYKTSQIERYLKGVGR
jgi:hypothetical protein